MDVARLVHENRQNADMEGHDLRVLFYQIRHHNPGRFLPLIMTSYLYQ